MVKKKGDIFAVLDRYLSGGATQSSAVASTAHELGMSANDVLKEAVGIWKSRKKRKR